nr:MAG TPA: hypothetical protein [Caudoviricetes sp.]
MQTIPYAPEAYALSLYRHSVPIAYHDYLYHSSLYFSKIKLKIRYRPWLR